MTDPTIFAYAYLFNYPGVAVILSWLQNPSTLLEDVVLWSIPKWRFLSRFWIAQRVFNIAVFVGFSCSECVWNANCLKMVYRRGCVCVLLGSMSQQCLERFCGDDARFSCVFTSNLLRFKTVAMHQRQFVGLGFFVLRQDKALSQGSSSGWSSSDDSWIGRIITDHLPFQSEMLFTPFRFKCTFGA